MFCFSLKRAKIFARDFSGRKFSLEILEGENFRPGFRRVKSLTRDYHNLKEVSNMPQRKLDDLWKSKTDPPPKRKRVEPKPSKVEIESRSHEIEVKEPKKEKAIEAPCLNAVLGDKSKEKKSILKNVNLIKKNHRESYNKYIWQTTSDPNQTH